MPGQEKQKEFRSGKTTLKEGEMWGGDVCGGCEDRDFKPIPRLPGNQNEVYIR